MEIVVGLSFISWISNGILKVSISYICIVYEYDMVSMNTNEKLNVSKYKKGNYEIKNANRN